MTLQLELYQKLIIITYFGFTLFIISILTRTTYLLPIALAIMIPGCLLCALLALTNVHKKEIVFKWKKVKTELHLPFMRNASSFIATDNDGNKYKLNFLLIPRKIEDK